jgi:hypothetical protein
VSVGCLFSCDGELTVLDACSAEQEEKRSHVLRIGCRGAVLYPFIRLHLDGSAMKAWIEYEQDDLNTVLTANFLHDTLITHNSLIYSSDH